MIGVIASLIFDSFMAGLGYLIFFFFPGFVTFGIMYLLIAGLGGMAYKTYYTFNTVMDRLVPWPGARRPIEWSVIAIPAVFVGFIFAAGPGHSLVSRMWERNQDKPVAQQIQESHPKELVSTTIRRYRLAGFRPPNNYYVDLEDLESKTVLNNLYVGASCDAWDKHTIGDEFNFQVHLYRQGDQQWYVIGDLHTMCNR